MDLETVPSGVVLRGGKYRIINEGGSILSPSRRRYLSSWVESKNKELILAPQVGLIPWEKPALTRYGWEVLGISKWRAENKHQHRLRRYARSYLKDARKRARTAHILIYRKAVLLQVRPSRALPD